MRFTRLGRRGPRVSVVAIGSWQAGSRLWGRLNTSMFEEAVARAVELGVNLFDTAELYGLGLAEERLGNALRRAGALGDVVIVDKIAGYRVTWSGFRKAARGMARRLGRRPDIILYHWPPPYPYTVCKIARLLERLAEEGYTGWVGFSNFNGGMIARAAECMARHEPVAVQVHYSLAHRSPERDVIPAAEEHGLTVMAWGPLAKGALAGKTRPDNPARLLDPVFHRAARDTKLQTLIGRLAAKHGVPRAAIALAWLIAHRAVPVVGARRAKHVEDAAMAAELQLPPEDLKALDIATLKYVGRGYSELHWNRLIPPPLQALIYTVLLRGI